MCLPCLALAAAPGGPVRPQMFPAAAAPLPWPDGDPIGGTLTWTGVAGYVLDAEGTRIVLDPFVTRPPLLRTLLRPARSDAALVAETFGAPAAAFVNHAHFDHAMDVPALAAAAPGCVVHGSRTLVELCRRADVPDGQLRVIEDGESVTTGPFTVTAVAAAHGVVPIAHRVDAIEAPARGLPRTAFRWPRGDVLAYRIQVGGRVLHVHGSAGIDDAALARQEPADVLIACVAARRGTPRYLDRLADRLRPKILVPCHHDDFFRPLSRPPAPVAQLAWDDLLADADRLAERYGTRLVTLPRGVPVPF